MIFLPVCCLIINCIGKQFFLLNLHDVKWPRKVKLVTPMRLEPDISKTAGDRLRSKVPPIGNGLWGILNDLVTDVVTLPRKVRPQYA